MDVGASSLGWSVERFKKCLQNLYFMFAIKEWLDVQDDALISGVQLFMNCVAGQCLISSVLSGKQDGNFITSATAFPWECPIQHQYLPVI